VHCRWLLIISGVNYIRFISVPILLAEATVCVCPTSTFVQLVHVSKLDIDLISTPCPTLPVSILVY